MHVIIILLLLLVVWPSGFPAMNVIAPYFTPFEVAAFRLGTAGIILAATGLFMGIRLPSCKDIGLLVLSGLLGLVAYSATLVIAQRTITASEASFVISTSPIFVAILACFFLKETIGWRTSIGIAISFMGTGAIAFAKSGTISFEIGVLFALIAALSQALFTLWQKPLLGRYSALEVTTYSMLAGALFSLPFGWTVFETVQTVPNDVVFALVYLSVFASAVGYIMWAYVLSYYPASKTASFLYVIPVSATVIAWIWIGQEPSAITLVGGAITLLGVAIVNVRRQQKKEAKGEAK